MNFTDKFIFHRPDKTGSYRWTRKNRAGRAVAKSTTGFESRELAMADAKTNGWLERVHATHYE